MEKKFFYITLLLIFLGLLILGGFTYIVDPQQQFRYNKNYVSGEQRIINLGLANNYNYETVIIGTSTSENILKEDVDKLFNTNSVNLSIMGATAFENRRLLNEIINKKGVKTIIYGLDYFSYNYDINQEREKIINYQEGINIIKYLFSISSLESDLKILIKEILDKNEKDWINRWSYWGDEFSYSKELALDFSENTKNGRQNLGQLKIAKAGYNLKNLVENLSELEKIIEKNKKIEYKIYLPPYSILYWDILEEYGSLNIILEFKKSLIERLSRYKNVKVYDFQEKELIKNLDNYKDSVHYSPKINLYIVESISKDSM